MLEKLKHRMEKKNLKFRCAVVVSIKVACFLYKLAHAVEYLQCNKLFVIGKSIVHLILWEFVDAVNAIFKNQL